jgi:hypothetical protein
MGQTLLALVASLALTGTDQVFVARPDPRDCYPQLPACGGRFMLQITHPVEDLCNDPLPFAGYATRVVIIDDDGNYVEIDPPCSQPLPGYFADDPMYPGYQLFVYLPYAG